MELGTTGFDLLNPTAFPWSMSSSENTGKSSGSSSTYSGLDRTTASNLANMLMPELRSSVAGISNLPQTYTQNAQKLYEQLMRRGLDTDLQTALQGMANRGMIGGDVVSNALSQTAADIIPNISMMGYQANMDAANMAQNIPGILGSLMELAKYTQGSSRQSSSNKGQSMSYSEDRSVPQGQLYDFLSGLDLSFL